MIRDSRSRNTLGSLRHACTSGSILHAWRMLVAIARRLVRDENDLSVPPRFHGGRGNERQKVECLSDSVEKVICKFHGTYARSRLMNIRSGEVARRPAVICQRWQRFLRDNEKRREQTRTEQRAEKGISYKTRSSHGDGPWREIEKKRRERVRERERERESVWERESEQTYSAPH